ncbi:anti-sigma factor family protein [Phormidesmis sp. 146-33]
MQPSPIDPSTPDTMNNQVESNPSQRDRFELLSAYLDGEVTAAERKQVEEWLVTDVTVQQLHSRLLKLRQGFRSLPTPQSQPVEVTVEKVFARLDRRPKLSLVWGGTAIAALFVGAVTIFAPMGQSPTPEMARRVERPAVQSPQENLSDGDGLLVALDQPVLSIPKTATVDSKAPTGLENKSTSAH